MQQYNRMNIIKNGDFGSLWLGDWAAARNKQLLKQENIKTVLTVAALLNIEYDNEIIHKVYNIIDDEFSDISQILDDTFKQIEEGLQRGSVLVHCAAGVSRSASAIIAYLIRKENMSYEEAFNFTKQKRNVISPNVGFQKQLKQYDQLIHGNAEIEFQNPKPIEKQTNQQKTIQQLITLNFGKLLSNKKT